MDKADAKFKHVPGGVAVRNGPVLEDKMEVDEPVTNGNAKRKARTSTSKAPKYVDSESEEDAIPLVGTLLESMSLCFQILLYSRPPTSC